MSDRYDNATVTIPALGIERRRCATVIRGMGNTNRTRVWWFVGPQLGHANDPDIDAPDEGVYIVNDKQEPP